MHRHLFCSIKPAAVALGAFACCLNLRAAPPESAAPKKEHLAAIAAEKSSRTNAQQKLECHLLFAARADRGEEPIPGISTLHASANTDANGRVTVEIHASVTQQLLDAIQLEKGEVLHSYPDDKVVIAALPLQRLENLAEFDGIRFIKLPSQATLRAGPIDSEGDTTHGVNGSSGARARYNTDGTGVKIGVLSDGVDSLTNSQNSGELGGVTVLAGQANKGDEGTAMLEIVHDIAPGAQLFYATGITGDMEMAANIRALQAAGCTIIVDDIGYGNEPPFQDGVIAQAVNDVSAKGVLYFSAIGNDGNKDSGIGSTWEGDFVDGGVGVGGSGGRLASFGTKNFNTNPTLVDGHGKNTHIELFWSDPLGGSTNDYDLIVTDANDNVVNISNNMQNGTQDPHEEIFDGDPAANVCTIAANQRCSNGVRIYIFKHNAAAPRFLHLCTDGNPLEISTGGSGRGHAASGAANAFSVAAAPASVAQAPGPAGPFPLVFSSTSKFELFTSDGPRHIFYKADGTAITPTDFTSTGGQVLLKPDFTAADGVQTSVPFAGCDPNTNPVCFNPFHGTSAAAPHAAALAALLKSKFPTATGAQIRDALTSTAIDIGAAGWDPDSGAGIIMPFPALGKLGAQPSEIALVGKAPGYSVDPNQVIPKPTTGSSSVTVNVRVTGAPVGGGSVRVFTLDGTARCEAPNLEFACTSQTVNFGAGDSVNPVVIQVNATATDFNPNGNGTFTVNLDTAVHGTISVAQATIGIIDEAAPAVTVSVSDTQVVESNPNARVNGGAVNATFHLTLSAPSDRPITVRANTLDVTATATGVVTTNDYSPVDTFVTFAPGQTLQDVAVRVVHTPIRNEPEETFKLNLSNAANAVIAQAIGTCTIHQPITPGPAVNISTRMKVLTDSNALIGGFIITGTEAKKVIVRGLGPSLTNVSGTLADPVLQLFSGSSMIAANDDWKENQAAVLATGIPPTNDAESAIVTTLNPGAYTAILSGKSRGIGVGLVEVYDLALTSNSALANISTRGFVDTGDNVMIGGFIVGANSESAPTKVIIRALGPSLPVTGALQDPVLELHDGQGATLARNDNWKDTQEAAIRYTQIPPSDDRESAIVATLPRGAYTAIVRGNNNSTGIALIEVYKLN